MENAIKRELFAKVQPLNVFKVMLGNLTFNVEVESEWNGFAKLRAILPITRSFLEGGGAVCEGHLVGAELIVHGWDQGPTNLSKLFQAKAKNDTFELKVVLASPAIIEALLPYLEKEEGKK